MAKVTKIPYYVMESSSLPFMKVKWKEYSGSEGCVPLDTQKGVSMERLAPGEIPPPPPPKPPKLTRDQIKAQKAEEAHQKLLAQQAQSQPKPTAKTSEKPTVLEAEECKNPPIFDLQDIPDAMEKMKWPVAAKLARIWFGSSKNIWDNDPISVQPIVDTAITLDWTLKFGSVKKKFDELIFDHIYNINSLNKVNEKVGAYLKNVFIKQKSTSFSFNTAPSVKDLR